MHVTYWVLSLWLRKNILSIIYDAFSNCKCVFRCMFATLRASAVVWLSFHSRGQEDLLWGQNFLPSRIQTSHSHLPDVTRQGRGRISRWKKSVIKCEFHLIKWFIIALTLFWKILICTIIKYEVFWSLLFSVFNSY